MFLDATSRDFDALAGAAADRFMTKSEDLSTVVAEMAKAQKLNPMEIKRLVEKANTQAMVKLLNVSKDKKAEFDLADYDAVMGKVYQEDSGKDEKPVEKTAGEIPLSFPDRRNLDKVELPLPGLEKVAQERQELPSSIAFRLTRERETLQQQKLACEFEITRDVEHLISEFSKYRAPDFSKFANEAYTLHGKAAAPLLKAIASEIKDEIELTKVAGVIDDRNHLLQRFGKAQDSLERLTKLAEELDELTQKLDQSWKAVHADAHL